ncbi:aarF domain-containing protein kinase 1-like [Lytechinus variegatus]|uniref:aarF domain-containing protein kinase 1-like n=1 Tax=Lytechinus variegatus TaxID=7654 RepID=UPI001BB14859|nr:aarF domain-containing protein kinase 1-like [Lytechinus variegatus]
MMALRYLRNGFRRPWMTLSILGGAGGAGVAIATDQGYIDWSSVGVVRFGRAFFSAGAIVVDYKWNMRGKESGSTEYKEMMSTIHKRSAERLHRLCCKNGGIFIKLGQHVGALDYLLPEEYVSTIKVLHNDAPQSSLKDIKKVVAEDLGIPVDDLFSDFSEEPVGTASLAQVHTALLKNGTKVAVKVQHPNVKSYSEVDMRTVEFLLNAVARIFPEFELLWLAQEMREKLPIELDFVQEGKNAEKVAQMLKHFKFLKVPDIYWQQSTSRVLTMEYCNGGKVDNKEYMDQMGIDVNQITKNLGKMYSEMIFVNGYVHCDPHPGNVLIRHNDKKEVEIVLLDHGLYQTLTDDFRLDYSRLWQSILAADLEGIKHYSMALGAGQMYGIFACMLTARSWDSLAVGIDKKQRSAQEDREVREHAAQYISEITKLLNMVPRQMLLLFKTNDLLRSIEYALGSSESASSFINMSRCCVRSVAHHEALQKTTRWGRLMVHVRRDVKLLQISAYEIYLWLMCSSVVRWFRRTFRSLTTIAIS